MACILGKQLGFLDSFQRVSSSLIRKAMQSGYAFKYKYEKFRGEKLAQQEMKPV